MPAVIKTGSKIENSYFFIKYPNYRVILWSLLVVLSILTGTINAQYLPKQANIWYFGDHAGLSFNSTPPTVLIDGQLTNNEGCASIADTSGNLLFYTNGMTVWTKNHTIMNNGNNLNGNISSCQSAIIVPLPNSSSIFYIFTIDYVWGNKGCQYSVVDMSYNNGLGKVIIKNNLLLANAEEKVTAVQNGNNRDIWIITHTAGDNKFYSFKLTPNGLDTTPVVSSVGINYIYTQGYLKASPDGTQLAAATYTHNIVELYDFNNNTGQVSNARTIDGYPYPYGVEFSPDGKKLYVTTFYERDLFQFDLTKKSIQSIKNSVIQIADGVTATKLGALQIGPDQKIYVARRDQYYLGVINAPNNSGTSCNFNPNGVNLSPKQSKLGLPSFIQSYFQQQSLYSVNICFGDTTFFFLQNFTNIKSVLWNFGDPLSGSYNQSTSLYPYHIFSSPGSYKVTLITHFMNYIDTVSQMVTISQKPVANFLVNDTMQCLQSNLFNITNNSSSLADSITYFNWSCGDNTYINNSQNFSHSYSSEGNYIVSLTISTSAGCMDKISKQITVFPQPISKFRIVDSSQCIQDNLFKYINLSKISSGSLSYHWDFGDSNISNNTSPNHSYSYADSFNVLLIATSENGCKDSTSHIAIVHVHPKPKADFSINDSAQCLSGNNFIFENKSSIPGGKLFSSWVFDDGRFSIDYSPAHQYLSSDTFKVQLKVTSEFQCKDSISKFLIVFPQPKAKIDVDTNVKCFKNNIFKFIDNSFLSSGSHSCLWNFGDGVQTKNNNPFHSYLKKDSFTVKLIIESDFLCSDSTEKAIYIRNYPKAKFNSEINSFCDNNNITSLINESTILSDSNKVSYTWSFGDGVYSTLKSPTHQYKKAGQYQILLIVHDDLNCFDSMLSDTISIVPAPVTNFKILSNCIYDTLVIINNSYIPYPDSIIKYIWVYNNDTSFLKVPSFYCSSIYPNSISLIAKSNNYCTDTTTKKFYVGHPISNPIVERATVFDNNNILVEWLKPKNGNSSYFSIYRSFDGSSFHAIKNLDYWENSYHDLSVNTNKTFAIYLVTSTDSCNNESGKSNIGKTILLQADTSSIVPHLFWNSYQFWLEGVERYDLEVFNESLNLFQKVESFSSHDSFFEFFDHRTNLQQQDYYYRVIAYRNGDNLESVSNIVHIKTKFIIWIPTVFTPNNDGTNDIFKIVTGQVTEFHLLIFNRWGEKIFESFDIKNRWDGTFNNHQCEDGVYYYQLFVRGTKGQNRIKFGTVTLLR